VRVDSRFFTLTANSSNNSIHLTQPKLVPTPVAADIILLGAIGLHGHRKRAGDFRRDLKA